MLFNAGTIGFARIPFLHYLVKGTPYWEEQLIGKDRFELGSFTWKTWVRSIWARLVLQTIEFKLNLNLSLRLSLENQLYL